MDILQSRFEIISRDKSEVDVISETCFIVQNMLVRVAKYGEEDGDLVTQIYEEAEKFCLEVSAGTEDTNDGGNDV